MENGDSLRPKVVCHYLLEKMRLAGITKAYIVLREGKWDIPAYLGDGKMLDMHLAYLMMRLPFGVPYTLDQAYPFVQDALVALGFPDIIFQPRDAFLLLLAQQAVTSADMVLGLFPTDQQQDADMVELDDNGRVLRIIIKPFQTHLRYTWMIAVWSPVFTRFMHDYLVDNQRVHENDIDNNKTELKELSLSELIQAAIDNNLLVESVLFHNGSFLDIGTPATLFKAVKNIAAWSN
jgi:glucose-1-phosphate thymidylyltransferase